MLTSIFAFMATKIGRTVLMIGLVLSLCVAGYGYYKVTNARMASLSQRATLAEQKAADLSYTNQSLMKQMAQIKLAEDIADASLARTRSMSVKSSKAIQNLVSTSHMMGAVALEQAVNKQQNDRLQMLRSGH